ncbi:hypothetical protein [Amygdalobacter nucleatus]|uniref:hypothetical protein n=1 Tax=Amygdalobacter nucleatus TaxID=3029274 RepID=UPI00279E25C5|nr:hypothetical protein [Amygdalobacter nucleatus]WEG37255.1 hypothetical protein PYS63_02085 [Amygdalobacter nucleatus]
MKRITSAILLIAMLNLCACQQVPSNSDKNTNKTVTTSNTTAQSVVLTKPKTLTLRNHIQLKAQELNSSQLCTEYNNNYYLPKILCTYKSKIFFLDSNCSADDKTKHIGVYDFKSGIIKRLAVNDIEMDLMGQNNLILDEKHFVYAYVVWPEHPTNERKIKLIMCDFSNKPKFETLAELKLTPQYTQIEKLNEEELAIFFHMSSFEGEKRREIYIYNLKLKKFTKIYSETGDTKTVDAKLTYACSCYGGKIHLLMHQSKDGKFKTFIRTLDKNAKQVGEFELTAISDYGSPDETVRSMLFDGDLIFLDWTKLYFDGKKTKRTVPECVVLQKTNDSSSYQVLDTSKFELGLPNYHHRQKDEPYIFRSSLASLDPNKKASYFAFYPEDSAIDILTSSFNSPFAVINQHFPADSTSNASDKVQTVFIQKVEKKLNKNQMMAHYYLEK